MDQRKVNRRLGAACLLTLGLLGREPARAGGFAVFEQSAKAMGMAAALTAQSDDPSTLFYNVGGAAFFKQKAVAAGLRFTARSEASFTGRPPNSSVVGVFELEKPGELLPNAYWIQPLRPGVNLGLAVTTPFYLDTAWRDADRFAGREVSLSSKLVTYDVSPSLALRLGPKLGFGVGAVYRTSKLSLGRRVLTDDPFSGERVDIASLDIDSAQGGGVGWNAGLFHQVTRRFSWGLSYRSAIEIDYSGAGRLTQILTGNQQLDDLVAAKPEFDQDLPLVPRVEFPAVASFGVACDLGQKWRLAADVNWTGWSSFEELVLKFTDYPGVYDTTFEEHFTDALSYRLGLEITTGSGSQWRFGVAFDETPQPEASVGPFLADADRITAAASFGKDWLDLAVMWVTSAERTASGREPESLNGTYQSDALLFSITLKKKKK